VQIIIAAALGSVLLLSQPGFRVHFTALREDFKGVRRENMASIRQILKDSYLLDPHGGPGVHAAGRLFALHGGQPGHRHLLCFQLF
jgi:hypothetical protein